MIYSSSDRRAEFSLSENDKRNVLLYHHYSLLVYFFFLYAQRFLDYKFIGKLALTTLIPLLHQFFYHPVEVQLSLTLYSASDCRLDPNRV